MTTPTTPGTPGTTALAAAGSDAIAKVRVRGLH